MNSTPRTTSMPMDRYTATTLAAAAASRRPLLTGYPVPTSVCGVGIDPAAKQLTKELLVAQTVNRTLKLELAARTRQLDDLKLRYHKEHQNDRIFKESLEVLDAKNRAQAREIIILRAKLKEAESINTSNTINTSNHQRTNNGNDQITTEDAKMPTHSLVHHQLLQTKTGCPLCLTHKHTLLNCNELRLNGYLLTYHPLLDIHARNARTAAVGSSKNNYCHFSGYSTTTSLQQRNSILSPVVTAAAAQSLLETPLSPPFQVRQATTISPPPKNYQQQQQQHPIDLSSDTNQEKEQQHKGTILNESGANDADDNNVFADIILSLGETMGTMNSRGAKHKPITIDLDNEEECLQRKQEWIEAESLFATASNTKSQESDTNLDKSQSQSKEPANEDEAEIQIVAETGKNPLSDFAHPRFDCITKSFSKDPTAFCPNCYCYVCDVRASKCEHWKDIGDEDSHCFAHSNISKWKRRRSRVRSKRKRPERALKEIEFFLADPVVTKLPPKRKTRNPAYDSGPRKLRRQRTSHATR